MIKRKKLKEWVIPSLALFVVLGSCLCYYLMSNIIKERDLQESNNNYVTDVIFENTEPVNNEITTIKPIMPYNSDKVSINKYYYRIEDDNSRQEQSLIKYENMYMPNTGILYSSDEEFEIVATIPGKIKSIKEDKILGLVIEIESSDNVITVYESVANAKVNEGDIVKQGDVIATSGKNKLTDTKDNCLHFEVYKDSVTINPEDFYNMEFNA